MFAYIDRKKKLPVTTLLRAIGFSSDKDIIDIYGLADEVSMDEETLRQYQGRKLAAKVIKTWVEDFVDEDTGEVIPVERTEAIVERGQILDEQTIAQLLETDVKKILIQKEESEAKEYEIIFNTLQKDTTNTEMEAVNYIFGPDRNLGAYINSITGRNMLLWDGACHVHERFSTQNAIIFFAAP